MSWLTSNTYQQNTSSGGKTSTSTGGSWLSRNYIYRELGQQKPIQPVQTTPVTPTPQPVQQKKSGLLNRLRPGEMIQNVKDNARAFGEFVNPSKPIEQQNYQIGEEAVKYDKISEGASKSVSKIDQRIIEIEDEIVNRYYDNQKKLRIGIPIIGGNIKTPFDTPESMKIDKGSVRQLLSNNNFMTADASEKNKILKVNKDIETQTRELAKERKNLLATKELYNEILSHDRRDTTFWEGLKDGMEDPGELMPFIGSVKQIGDLVEIYKVQNKKANNIPLSKYEESVLKKEEAKAFEDIVNQKGIGYTLGQILIQMPTYGVEFLATGGISSLASGSVSKIPAVVKIAQKSPIASKLISGLAGATAQTTLGFSQSYIEKAMEYAVDEGKTYDFDEGLVIDYAGSKEDLNKALMDNLPKGYAMTWMEVAGEKSGEGMSYIGKGLMAKYLGKNGVKTLTEAEELVKKTGWNGIVSEILEEELTYAGQSAVEGTEYKAPGLSAEANQRLLLEVLSIGIYGSLLKTGTTVMNKATSTQAEATLKEEAKKQGISDEEVNNFITELKNAGTEGETKSIPTLEKGTEAVTLYRGLNEDRQKSKIPYEEGVTFYTTDKATADDYSSFQTDDRIKDLEKKKEGLESSVSEKLSPKEIYQVQNEILGINNEIKQIQQEINKNPELLQIKEPKGKVEEVQNPLKNPLVIDAKGKNFDEVTENAIKKAKENGNDGVVINNVVDAISKENAKPITTVIVFNKETNKTEEAIKKAGGTGKDSRPQHQIDIENLINEGKYKEAKAIAEGLAEDDPYKKSMLRTIEMLGEDTEGEVVKRTGVIKPGDMKAEAKVEVTAKGVETEEQPLVEIEKTEGSTQINDYLYNTYGKDTKTATKTQILDASTNEPFLADGIEYDADVSRKFGKNILDIKEMESKPALIYGGLNNGVFTNGYLMILDEVEARKLNTKAIDQAKTRNIKDLTKSGISFPEATDRVKQSSNELITKYTDEYPDYKQVIPEMTKDYVEVTPKVIYRNYLVLSGENRAVSINPDYYQYMMNNLKDVKVLAKEEGNSPILFVDNNDEIKAIVMPIRADASLDKFKQDKKGGEKSEASSKEGTVEKKQDTKAKKPQLKAEAGTYGYIHNTSKAPKPGLNDDYGQKIEPAGKYMNLSTVEFAEKQGEYYKKNKINNIETGTIKFANPLIIDATDKTSKQWKVDLSKKYNGKKGQALSRAIIADGYDGIITTDRGEISESVHLTKPKKKSINKKKPSTSKTKADKDTYADAGDYGKDIKKKFGESYTHIKPIEMPELVQLVKDIMGGKTPLIKKFRMNARGFFRPATMDIVLRPELFEDPSVARKTLAHEIGHLVDYLPDFTMKRGNILGRIATLRGYQKSLLAEYKNSENVILTPEDRARLRKEARKRVKEEIEVTEEIVTGELPLDPKDILDIWNDTTASIKNPELVDYIAKLSSQEKKEIVKQALKGEIPAWVKFKKQIKETITRKVIKNAPSDVKKAYNDLVKEEIIKRRLFSAEVIRKELISLSAFWKPFDRDIDAEYTAYRDSGEELYADALSVLFNDPALLKTKAPNFMTGFFNYLDEKPEIARVFTELQDMLNAGEDQILQRRNQMLNDMYDKAEDKYVAKEIEKRTRKKSIWTELRILLDTKNARVYQDVNKVRKLGSKIPDSKNPSYLLEELPYSNAYIKNKIEALFQDVKTLAETVDNGWVELGKILQLERSIYERGELANPGGFDPKTAQDTLDYIKSQHTQAEWDTLQKAKNKFRNSMQDVIKMAEEGGYYKPEMIEQMKANQTYATYQVVDYLDTYISPAIHKSVGTFKDVSNPATSSVMKVISTLKAIERNTAKREVIDFYQEYFPESITKAPTRWNGKFQEVVEKKVPQGKTLVKIIRDGTLEGYYVDSDVGTALNGMSQELIASVAYYARKVTGSNFYRAIFTGLNIGFQTTNLMRDFKRYWKNLPDKTIGDAILSFFKTFRDYGKATKPAWDRARSKQNETIKAMEDLKILDLNYNNAFSANEDDLTQIDRTFRRLGLDVEVKEQKKLRQQVLMVTDALTTLSNFIEGIPKIAGYEYLKGQGMEDKEMASFIRTMLGSPNFREGGLLTPITNSIFLFSNAIKEGYKSDFRAFKNPETRGAFFFKMFIANILPKLIMLAIAGGLLGDKFKKMMGNVSEYNKTNYTIIPLGVDENGKTIYLRIPEDETGRLVSGLVWKSLNLFNKKKVEVEDLADLFSFYAGQVPSLAPRFSSMKAIMQYLSGQNPYDEFRNRNIIPDLEFKGGYKYSLPIFMDWLIKSNGGGIVLPSYKPSATDMTDLEKTLNLPGVSNILGRWLQVSDYGKTEQYQEIKKEVDQKRAVETLEENKSVETAYDSYKDSNRSDESYNKIVNDMLVEVYGKSADELNNAEDSDLRSDASNTIKKLNTAIIRGKADPEVNALISATSNEAKAELLDAMLMEMKADEIQTFLTELLDQKIITADVLEKYQELNK